MKHIEQIQPEYAADDMTALLLSDATASAALSRLLHDWTGCAIPQASDLPQSEVEELVPLCLSILRRHWQTPLTALGDGTTPMSLADLLRQTIGDRVQGNEAWAIPPANANIPTAVAQLRARDMSSGLTLTLTDGTVASLPDGLSLAQLLCGTLASQVTEIVDDNTGWTNNKGITYLLTLFPNVNTLRLKFKNSTTDLIYSSKVIENLYLDEYEGGARIVGNGGYGYGVKNLYVPKMTWLNAAGGYTPSFGNKLVHLYAPLWAGWNGAATNYFGIVNCPDLVFAEIGDWTDANTSKYLFYNCPILIEVRLNEQSHSLDLRSWSPTTALSERLDEFLSNFKTYIANRLTDKGSGLTLTLSQAVRDAIQNDPEIVSIITSKGWTISPAPSV